MSLAVELPVATKPTRWHLLAFVAVFCVLWSLAFAVSKIAVEGSPPLLFLTARFLVAGVALLAITRAMTGEDLPAWRDVAAFAIIGLCNNALYLGLSYTGFRSISAGLGGLVVSANPVLTALLATLLLHERLTWRKIAGLALGVVGVALIVQHRLASGQDSGVGIAFMIGALFSIVSGTILFKWLAPKGGLVIGNAVQNLAGGLALAPLAFSLESVGDIVPSGRLLAAFAYLVVLGSIVGYLLWLYLLREVGAVAASSYHFMMPPLGVMFGWLLLGEHVSAFDMLGIIPVALGIYLVTRPVPSQQ